MKEKIEETQERASKVSKEQMQELQKEILEIQKDVLDVKETWKHDKPNGKRTTKHVIAKHRVKLALAAAIGTIIWFVGDFSIPTIPEWVFVVATGIIAGIVIGFIPAKVIVDKLIRDNRKPVLEINKNDMETVALWLVPESRITDIEMKNGEKVQIETEKGIGYQIEQLFKVEENGKQKLIAEGTWEGEKSSLEVKRDYANIESQKKHLLPFAMRGFAYDIMFPHIIREIQASVGTQMAEVFEGVAVFEGEDINKEIDDIIEKYDSDNIIDQLEEKDSVDQLAENGHTGSESVMFDSDIEDEKEILKQFLN